MQRAEAARIAHVQADVFIQQALDGGHHHLLVAGGARFGARAQQQQQRRDRTGGGLVRLCTSQQQGVEQRQQARTVARTEAIQGRAVQRRQLLGIAGMHIGTGGEQARHDVR
ncbi:hypothetical protein D3C73_1331890 [compost metagenome]